MSNDKVQAAVREVTTRIGEAFGFTKDLSSYTDEYELKLKGTDSFGYPVSFAGTMFMTGDEMLFATNFFGDYESGDVIEEDEFCMSIPDKECEYLDLQLYERKMLWETEEITDEIAVEDDAYAEYAEYAAQEAVELYEAYAKEENYGWKPVGEPFRISITR